MTTDEKIIEYEEELINKIVDNGNVSAIPSDLRERIMKVLENKKFSAIMSGDSALVSKIQSRLSVLDRLIKKEKEKHLKETKKEMEGDKVLIDGIIEKLIKGNPMPISKSHLITDIIARCKEKIVELVQAENLRDAQKYSDIIKFLNKNMFEFSTARTKVSKMDHVHEQYERVKQMILEEQTRYEEEISKLESSRADEYRALVEKLNLELEEFDKETNTGDIPPSFVKYSRHYLNLRELQDQLVAVNRFIEAHDVRKEADELQDEEHDEMRFNYFYSRQTLREKLIKDHTLQLECFEDKTKSKRFIIQNKHEKAMSDLNIMLQNAKRKLDHTSRMVLGDAHAKSLTKKTLQKKILIPNTLKVSRPRTSFNKIDIITQTLNVKVL